MPVPENLRAPIWNVTTDIARDQVYDSPDNLIPIDPWGNPYLFFPPSGETNYTNAVIYSMGPNGAPGNGETLDGVAGNRYLRPPAGNPALNPDEWLGGRNSDDLMVQF